MYCKDLWRTVALTVFLLSTTQIVHSLLVSFNVRNTIKLFGLYGWIISLFVSLSAIAMVGLYLYCFYLIAQIARSTQEDNP